MDSQKRKLHTKQPSTSMIKGSGFGFLKLSELSTRTGGHADSVTAVSGGTGHLPCDLTPPTPEDRLYLALWYKDDSPRPLYSLDGRGSSFGDPDTGQHWVGEGFSGRAHFLADHQPALLRLEPVQPDDRGRYRCRVDFRIAKSRTVDVLLNVLVTPGEPVIRDQFGEVVKGEIGPYTEGQKLLLTCDVSGGDPPPRVTWWLNGDIIDDVSETSTSDLTQNQLRLKTLDRSQARARLTCVASNTNLTDPAVNSVHLNLYLRPLKVTIDQSFPPLLSGRTASVNCWSSGSHPPATLTWWLDGVQPLSEGTRQWVTENGTVSELTFRPTARYHGRQITCRAENTQIPHSVIEDSRKLRVLFLPSVQIRLGPNLRHSNIREGHDVYFECEVSSNPETHEVTWALEGRELHTNKSAGLLVTERTLVIQRVNKDHRGAYTCSASNIMGTGRSQPLQLRIQFAPVCRPTQVRSVYGVSRHKAVRVACDVDADPETGLTFQWSFNGSAAAQGFTGFAQDRLRSAATYLARTDADYGSLACWATNSVGTQVEPCRFSIVPAGPPEPLHNCSMTNETLVRCFVEPRGAGLLRERYHLEVWDDQLQRTVFNYTRETPLFQVNEIPAGRSLTLTAYASNELGVSGRVVLSGVTLATSDRLTHKGEPQRLLPVVIVTVSLLVTSLLCLTLLIIVKRFRAPCLSMARSSGQDDDSAPDGEVKKHPPLPPATAEEEDGPCLKTHAFGNNDANAKANTLTDRSCTRENLEIGET